MASDHQSISPKSITPVVAQLPASYKEFLEEVKRRVLSSQVKAAIKVNHELILLY